MAGRVTLPADDQPARSRPPLPGPSSATKKISCSFESKDSSLSPSVSFSPPINCSSGSANPSSSCKFSLTGASRLPCQPRRFGPTHERAVAAPKQVLSIFCTNEESGSDAACSSRSRVTQQVLSFDRYSGWETKTPERAREKEEKSPRVIPCLHPLTRRRPTTIKREQTEVTPAAANLSRTAAAYLKQKGVAAAAAEQNEAVAVEAELKAEACRTRAAPAQEGKDALTATEKPSSAIGEGEAPAATGGEKAGAGEGDMAGKGGDERNEERRREPDEKRKLPLISTTPACGGALDESRARAEQRGTQGEQESYGTALQQQRQARNEKVPVRFGLIKREHSAGLISRTAEKPSSSPLKWRKGRQPTDAPPPSPTSGRSALNVCVTVSAASAPLSSSASSDNVVPRSGITPHTGDLAAADADDTGELAARAFIAEARGEASAASAAAGGEVAGVPILARNARLAALRRSFGQRLQSQQQEQNEQQRQQQQQNAQAQQRGQQQEERRFQGWGNALYETTCALSGGTCSLFQADGDRYTLSRRVSKADGGKGYCCTGKDTAADALRGLPEPGRGGGERCSASAAGGSGGFAAAGTAATLSGVAAADGSRRNNALFANEGGARDRESEKQRQTTFSRDEAEKELLRQELKLLPDAPNAYSSVYAAVPVAEFGLAMLRGMGYDPVAAAAKSAAVVEEEGKRLKKRTYTRAGFGSEREIERLWAEREKKLKEEAMKEKKRKLEEMLTSRYYR